ncbi:MAG: sigma-70 family RNA polymerase sigma factor [Chitinivibrionales bacterium]|nr:sigma-70 family RNA polymerase sigma factor [Chitinivibrionales bacterium]MBD3395116.1 sigma-70 family RNA polymerase sigma factor [Chitinivibrionales bacterium]
MDASERQEDRSHFDAWVRGEPAGFTWLYDKYKNRVFAFLLRMTSERELAEDLLQETFLAALRNANQFDRNRSFLSWLFGIAHKRAIDHFRHAKVEHEHQSDAEKSVGTRIEAPDDATSNERMRGLVSDALETLDPLQREVFLLRELGDVPFKEIAHMMNCPINTALGRMRLALRNIRKELEKRGVHGVH